MITSAADVRFIKAAHGAQSRGWMSAALDEMESEWGPVAMLLAQLLPGSEGEVSVTQQRGTILISQRCSEG